jgi:hypothetical protein
VAHAQEAQRAEVAEQLARDLAGGLPGVAEGHDALVDETPHLGADHAVVLVQDLGFVQLEQGHRGALRARTQL